MCESLVRAMCLEGQAALLLKQDQKRSHYTPLSYLMLFSPMLYRLLLLFSYATVPHQICLIFHSCVFQDIKPCQVFFHQKEYQYISLIYDKLHFKN